MTEPNAFNLTDAALPDGTVDFYTLVGKPADTDAETLRLRIQALYSEATANRDNRNLKKRREYQTLLELLPPARAALLDPIKRARYDEFLAQARVGASPTDFETFINELMGFNDQMEEKTGLLATKDKNAVRAAPIEAPRPAESPRPKARPGVPAGSEGGNAYSTAPRQANKPDGLGGIIGLLGGFFLGVIIGIKMFHAPVPAVLLGIIIAALGFVALNGRVGTRKAK